MGNSARNKCEFCGDEVLNAEDYSNHLTITHNMKKGLDQIVERLNNSVNSKQTSEDEIEIIELDDEDDNSITLEMSSAANNIETQKLMEETAREMFKELHLMLDGILPETTEEEKKEIENLKDIKVEIPTELTDCFNELKMIVDNIQIPKDYFQQKTAHQNNISKSELKTTQSLSLPKTSDSNLQNNEHLSSSKAPNIVPKPGQTLFLCPFEKCDFYTTKKGFKDRSAANHFSKDHKVKPSDITPGTGKYQWKKLKGEKVQSVS